MKQVLIALTMLLSILAGCNKSSAPASASSYASAPAKSDPVQQKLQEYSGSGAADCGRLDVKANEAVSKAASDCAVNASHGKHPFYVAYDMPGMTVGVAGNADGKLFTVQSQGQGAITSGDCPSQLRVASSGRVTCFAPGDMGSMSGSHTAGPMQPGMANPHGGDMANPHAATGSKATKP